MRLDSRLESFMFAGRWMLAPFYLGLLLALGLLLIKFVKGFLEFAPLVFTGSDGEIIVALLSLVDVVLVANLLLMIVFAGYENFVSRMHIDDHEDRPSWMGQVGFSGLKMKLIGSIVAISAIELLRIFMSPSALSGEYVGWKLATHVTLVVSGLLFAIMDRIAEGTQQAEASTHHERP
ncbi:MAG: TIGR00645 family protein [Bdellovibrio bacteriovorus]